MVETLPPSMKNAGPTPDEEHSAIVFERLDTARGMRLLQCCSNSPTGALTLWTSFARPLLVTFAMAALVPLAIAALTQDSLVTNATHPGGVAYLTDWNVLALSGILTPVIWRLLLTERAQIPRRLAHIIRAGTLRIRPNTAHDVRREWHRKFADANRVGISIGLVLALAVGYLNYAAFTAPGFGSWQATDGEINPAGIVYVAWQLPLFYVPVTLYVVRGVTVARFLHDIVKRSEVRLQPFHSDNAGGLGKIGHIGLRNQVILALGGVNLVLFWMVSQRLEASSTLDALLYSSMSLYIVAGPIVFAAPLWPFRSRMLAERRRQQDVIGSALARKREQMMARLPGGALTKADHDEMLLLQEFLATVDAIPVWPFDARTRRKFLGAYVLPIATFVLSQLGSQAIQYVTGILIPESS